MYVRGLNVRDTDPGRHTDALGLFERTVARRCKLPGFVSASVHVGRNDTTLTNHARWRRTADVSAMLDTSTSGATPRRPARGGNGRVSRGGRGGEPAHPAGPGR